ncbi:unnamed protein product, partial [Mesorhabditis belari]|uniref:Potassium channel domain-containing protein n=1 Tax=Mesorhabditis belari TaxID=2138241 RepID=A0AAF3J241_9BILA
MIKPIQKLKLRKDIVPIEGANVNRFTHSLYWMAYRHSSIGFRHFMMLILMTALTIGGGYVFLLIERPAELELQNKYMDQLQAEIKAQSQQIVEDFKKNQQPLNKEILKEKLRVVYKKLLSAERRYEKSAYFKNETPNNMAWKDYAASVFFCTNAFMTVDYGTVPAISDLGRALTIIFSIVGIPLAIVVTRDLGQAVLYQITKLYSHCKSCRNKKNGNLEDTVALSPIVAIVLLFASWFLCAWFTYWYDGLFGDNSITYWGSIYLSYLTVTTIGMGDLLPTYTARDPVWKFFHFFVGMPFRIVNRCTYVGIEKSVFGVFKRFEKTTDSLFHKRLASVTPSPPSSEDGDRASPTMDVFGGDFGRVKIPITQLE